MKNFKSLFAHSMIAFFFGLLFTHVSLATNSSPSIYGVTGAGSEPFFEKINLTIDSAWYGRAVKQLETWQNGAVLATANDSLQYAESLRLLGFCNLELSKYDQAHDCLNRSSKMIKDVLGVSPESAKVDGLIGSMYKMLGEHDKAFEQFNEVLVIQQEKLAKGHKDFIDTYLGLAELHIKKGEYETAKEFAQKSLNIALKNYGENHVQTALAYDMIGYVHKELTQFSEAEESYHKCMAIIEKNYGDYHPIMALAYNNMGVLRSAQYKPEESLEFDKKALAIRIDHFGELHADVAWSYNNLAWSYHNLNKIKQAIGYHSKALEIRKFIFKHPSPWVADSFNDIGENYAKLGLYSKALKYYNEALHILREFYGDQSPELLDLLSDIGLAYDYKGDAEKYLEMMKVSLAIARKEYDENNIKMASVYINMATACSANSDYKTARFYIDKAQDIYAKLYGPNHPLVKLMPIVSSKFQDYYSNDTSAIRGIAVKLEKIVEELIPVVGANNEVLAVCNALIGKYYIKLHDYDLALLFLKKAEATLLEIFGEDDFSNVYETFNKLSQCYLEMDDFENAKKYNQKHLKMLGFLHNDVSVSDLERPHDIVEGLVTKGEIFEKIYRTEKDTRYLQLAEESYLQACNLTHLYRQENRAKKSQSEARQGDYYAFEKLLSVISQSHQKEPDPRKLNEAWLQMEKAKYNILFEALKKENAVAFGNIPDSLIDKESMISGEIAYYEKLRFETEKEADSTKTATLD